MARFCIHCGAELAGDVAFCMQCGQPVQAGDSGNFVQGQADPSLSRVAPVEPGATAVMSPASTIAPAAAPPAAPAAKKKSSVPLIAGTAVLVVALGVGSFFGVRALGLFGAGDDTQENANASASASTDGVNETSADVVSDQNQVSVAQPEAASSDATSDSNSSVTPEVETQKAPAASAPDLAGLSEADARTKIEEAGLQVGAVSYEKNDEIAKGNVISQNPASGTEMQEGTSVAFVVSDGKTQHRYELVSGSYTWDEARASAEGRGGYLACVTSADEWNQVLGLLPSDGISVVWIGAAADSSRNFAWVSGEEFSYNNWASGEPNNDGGNEDKLCLLRASGVWGWYDVPNDVSPYYTADKMGFVVEYED